MVLLFLGQSTLRQTHAQFSPRFFSGTLSGTPLVLCVCGRIPAYSVAPSENHKLIKLDFKTFAALSKFGMQKLAPGFSA